MKRRALWLLVACAAAIVASCGAPVARTPQVSAASEAREQDIQNRIALKGFLKREERLLKVSWPVLRHSAGLCPKVAPSMGTSIHAFNLYDESMQKAARQIMGDGLYVAGVAPDSPAQRAGLRRGDTIISIEGAPLEGNPEQAADELSRILGNIPAGTPIDLGYRRDGEELSAVVEKETVCDYPVSVVPDSAVNAFADGKAVYMTSGMMKFAESDDELAIVVGHELAHNTMDHIGKSRGNAMIGLALDVLLGTATGVDTGGAFAEAGAEAYSQEFEAEADYVGLYMAARAGYDIEDAPYFWRRMGAEHPDGINHASSHPTTASRFLALEKTAAEIQRKISSDLPLKPDIKDK